MEICKKCGLMMKVDKEKKKLVCSCGETKELTKKGITEVTKPQKEVEVIHDETHPLAVYPHKCPKCGYGKAQLVNKGIWYSDEDEVIEYVCGKCGFHDRQTDGVKVT